MQIFFSLLAALLLPASAFAQDERSWNARFQASFLGNDSLCRGRERVAEIPYGAACHGVRGPAAVHALRLHRES